MKDSTVTFIDSESDFSNGTCLAIGEKIRKLVCAYRDYFLNMYRKKEA